MFNTTKGDSNNGISNLKYNDKGLVLDDVCGLKGSITYYLNFKVKSFLNTLNLSSGNINFTFELGYNTYNSNYSLIDLFLTSSSVSIQSNSTSLLNCNLTPNSDTSNHMKSITTDSLFFTAESYDYIEISVDFIFSISSTTEYESIYENELTSSSFSFLFNSYAFLENI